MERINEVTKDCFNALIQLRALDSASAVSPQLPYQRLMGFIDQLLQKARAARFEEIDVVDMTYAIVALADEVALHKTGAVRDFWLQRPLQLHYFNENLAGEGFFARLAAVMSDPKRIDVLRVYYTCLLLGFQGQYAIRGGELQLDATIQQVKRALAKELKEEPLSVNPNRPREDDNRREGLPIVWIALFFLLFSLGLLIVLRIGLNRQTGGVINELEPLGEAAEKAGGK